MLLSLLGACAVVGPFQGPEWEPVRGLLSQDHSCRDPRCCGNLLVLCLFLIWQVRHYWLQVTRTRPSKKNIIKVPSQNRVVPSTRCETFFNTTPDFFSPGKFGGLDSHVQHWAQKRRWGYQRSLQQQWAQYLLSEQHRCQYQSWSVHTPSEPAFCTSSFSSPCLVTQNSPWEALRVPWCLRHSQTYPALNTCQRMERFLVHSQEKLVPLESVVSMRYHPTSTTLAISLPNLHSTQRLQFCPRDFLPGPSTQQPEMPIWKSRDSPQETWAPWSETQTEGRKYSRETQAPQWVDQRECRREDAWEIQASRGQLSEEFRMEDGAEAKALSCKNQMTVVISETYGEILTSVWENQDQMGTENRVKIEELAKKNWRENGDKNTSTQPHMGENQEQLRCKTDVQTQTPEWGNQGQSGDEDAVETRVFEKNEKETRGEEEGEIRAQGLGKQDWTGGENDNEFQMSQQGKEDQPGGGTGAETEAKRGRNEDRVGGEDAVKTQKFGRKNLGEVKQKGDAETQALKWEKQRCTGSDNVIEIQTPVGEKQGQSGGEKSRKIQAFRREKWNLSRHVIQVGKKLREIREEDWVVIQTAWWGNQSEIVSEIDREFKIPCWGNQRQVGGEYRAEIQAPEERDQREDGDADGTLTFEAENKRQLRSKTHVEIHPIGRKKKEHLEENGTEMQTCRKRNPRESQEKPKGENGAETQETGEDNQGQLRNDFNEKIHILKCKNQEHVRGNGGANTQTSEVELWGELTTKIDGETHSAEWKTGEKCRDENRAETQIQGIRILREARGEGATETGAAGEGSQSQLGSDTDRKIHLSEWKDKEQMGGEAGTETQNPEKRNQREPGSANDVKNQRPERENHRQLENGTGSSCSLGRGSWEQIGGENPEGNQASEKRNRRAAGSENGKKIQRLKRKKQRLLSKVNAKTYLSECKNQEQIRGGNGAETQVQGKRNLRGTTGDDGTETQATAEDDQRQSRGETDGEIQIQEQGNQNKGGDENAMDSQDVGSQRMCRAEGAGRSPVPRRGGKEQVRGKDFARVKLQGDYSVGEVPTGKKCSLAQFAALTVSGYGTLEHKQTVAVNSVASAPNSKIKPHPHQRQGGEGEHLATKGMNLWEYRAGVSPASQPARPRSQRRQQSNKGVDSEKASSLTHQPQNPQSPVLSVCHSLPCGQAPQAATALVGAPIQPTWPTLKKSKRLLLESLMRRRIAHLRWGLPRRILESYLLFNLLGSCSLARAVVRLPGLCTDQELQRQQERHCEVQGSSSGLKSSEKSQTVLPLERKNSKLQKHAMSLEKCRYQSESMGSSIPPKKPRRTRPRGGAREPQIQEETPKANIPAPRTPRLASDSRSWSDPEIVKESSSENSRDRKMFRPEVSQMAERAPSRVKTSSSRAGHDYWKKELECIPWEASESSRHKCQQHTYWRRSPKTAVGRGTAQGQPFSCSTDTFSFNGNVHCAAARLSMTLLNKMPWSSQLAKPQHSAPNLTLGDPTLFPKVGDLHSREDSPGIHTALKRGFQSPRHCRAGAALPRTKSYQGQGAPANPNRAPGNPSTPQKFDFMKHLRCFLFRCGLKK
ncbi:uncharacterized protein [Castor canadensis]|uniref:Uncharacterized protein n=1 Tax=Castor canadensis TaxID=51338 RepID=A0A8B7UW74_CASCN